LDFEEADDFEVEDEQTGAAAGIASRMHKNKSFIDAKST